MEAELVVLGAVWAMASALAIAFVGILTLSGGRARPPGALAFGLFALVWGIEIVVANAAGLVSREDHAARLYLLSQALLLPLPYFLMEFSAAHSEHGRRAARWKFLRGLAAGIGGLGALVLLFVPELILPRVFHADGHFYPVWGTLNAVLVGLPLFLALGIALLALNRAVRHAATPRIASRTATMLGGLGLYVAFAASSNLVFFGASIGAGVPIATVVFTVAFLFLAVLSLGVGLTALVAAREARGPDERRRDTWLAVALLLPLGAGFLEGILLVFVLPEVDTVGLWRLAGVGVIAFGLARWRLFDLPQRLRRSASSATGAVAAAATGATVYGATGVLTTGIVLPALSGLTVFTLALVPGLRMARRLFGLDRRLNPIEYENVLYEQRIDSYRAAVEAALARGALDEDEDFLLALRERYSITEDEDRVVRYYARNSVIVAREGDVSAAYERLRILGEGGGGRTWLARDRARDRLVVIKEPLAHWQKDRQLRDAVFKEAQLAAKVRHANVVTVEEVVETDGLPAIIMEFMDGGSVADLLRAKGVLSWRDALSLLHDVLSGLEAVHQRGIVHRDIKPSNILLTGDGTAKLADFGIAVSSDVSGNTVIEGKTGRAGTVAYMAPEVADGRSAGGVRADVYACAAVLHECLYGSPVGSDQVVLADNDVPAKVEAILARGLASDPMRRFPSARAFADELVRVSKE